MRKPLSLAGMMLVMSTCADAREVVLACTQDCAGCTTIVRVDFESSVVTHIGQPGPGGDVRVKYHARITPEFIQWNDGPAVNNVINRITGEWVSKHTLGRGATFNGHCQEASGRRIGD